MRFVRWDVICPKSSPSKTRFFYLSWEKLLPLLSPYRFQSVLYHVSFFVFMNYLLQNIGRQLNLTSFLKILRMFFINKNIPAKRDETFIRENIVPPKQDPRFMKVGSLLRGRICFHINRFWVFNSFIRWDLA